MWDPQIESLKADYRILAYDTRGHGESTAAEGPYSFEMLADDVFELLGKLKIQRTHFVGLSMGGMVGQTLALKHPGVLDRLGLASHAQTPQAIEQWKGRIAIAESKGLEPLVEPTLERWFTEPFRKGRPESVAKIAALIRGTSVAGFVGCGHALMAVNLTARLKDIKLPVLAITGEHDVLAPGTRYLGENIPGAKLVVIPNAAHIANVEQPDAFTRALQDFL